MPSSTSRQLLVWSLPTVAFVLTILWYRRRHHGSKRQTDPGGTTDSKTQNSLLTVDKSQIDISSPQVSNLSIENLREVILNQASEIELKISSQDKSFDNISVNSNFETESNISSAIAETLASLIEKEEQVLSESAIEHSVAILEVSATPEPIVEHFVVKSQVLETSVGTEKTSDTVTVLEEKKPVVEMTEVEEIVVTKATVESVDTAPAMLANISVDVSKSTTAEAATKTHQPRDSANHSPAEAMLASPSISNDSDTHSVGSNDSGKGGSDVTAPVLEENGVVCKTNSRTCRRTSSCSSACSDAAIASTVVQQPTLPCVYEFVIPQQLVGRLIGKHGCFVQQIKTETNSSIFVKRHPESPKFKVCAIEGTQTDIDEALKLIRKKFPAKKFPGVTLERVMFLPPSGGFPLIPESLQMYLVEGVNNDVILSSLVSAGHMFLQQPTHPTFPVLSRLIMNMTQCYTEEESPTLPNPAPGIVCAAPSMGGWYRAEVIDVRTEVEGEAEAETVCDIKFVDYGGFMTLPVSELRQIRTDFMMLPFQATECYLADITWLDGEEGWSEAATQCVEELTRDQVLQAHVVGYAENCAPFIRLFSSIHGPMAVMVNEMLVIKGVAKYMEPVLA